MSAPRRETYSPMSRDLTVILQISATVSYLTVAIAQLTVKHHAE